MQHWLGYSLVAWSFASAGCKSPPAPVVEAGAAVSATVTAAPASAPSVPDEAPSPAASGDAGARVVGVLEADEANAKVLANPKLVGTILTVRGRADTQEGSGGYGMLSFVDVSKPLPKEYVGHTHLCVGKYAEEQTDVKRNEVFTMRGKVGKASDKLLLLEACNVIPSR